MKQLIFEKFKSYKHLTKYKDFVSIMENYTGSLDPEKCLIDYKVHELEFGDCPARPIWHYDGTNNPYYDKKVRYELFLQGGGYCPTKFFIIGPKELPSGTEQEVHLAAKKYETANPNDVKWIDYNIWNLYSSTSLHAATKSNGKETRILIRLEEQNECL